jgi:glycerol kinase
MKKVASELNVHLIDLNQQTINLYNELGESRSAYISWDDKVHYPLEGAQVIAGMVVNAFPDCLGTYLTKVYDYIAKP